MSETKKTKVLTSQQKKEQVLQSVLFGRQETQNYEQHLHDVEQFGGETDVKTMIRRYEIHTTISDEEKKELLENVPPQPDFEVMSKDKYNASGCWQKRKYRSRVKDYFKKRDKYFSSSVNKEKAKGKLSSAEKFSLTRERIESRFKEKSGGLLEAEKEFHDKMAKATKAGYYKDIEADPKAIDDAFEERKKDDYEKVERSVGEAELNLLKRMEGGSNFSTVISHYTGQHYSRINSSLRNDGNGFKHYADHYKKPLKKHPLSRDLVVRRGVKGLDTLGHMMGLENVKQMSIEELEFTVTGRLNSGTDFIVSDKGFISTSLPYSTKMFSSGDEYSDGGIEFMILMKKGTYAANVTTGSANPTECEVLAAPGTKFRVIQVYTEGTGGNKGNWKVYLESIPGSEEGVEK